jgi:hypothetical protein
MPQIPTAREVGEGEWCPEQDEDLDVRYVYSRTEARVPMKLVPRSPVCHNGVRRGNCLVGTFGSIVPYYLPALVRVRGNNCGYHRPNHL